MSGLARIGGVGTAMRSREVPQRRTAREHALIVLEGVVGAWGIVGGALLAAQPDGSLLQAKLSALRGSPFSDYRVPGILLAVLVGGGLLGAAVWLWQRWPYAHEVALASAVGLLLFEVVEFALIGFQGLQVVIGLLAVVIGWLAWGLR